MSRWKSVDARRLLSALLRIGWEIAWQKGSHRRLKRDGWPHYTFAFHDGDEIGPRPLPQSLRLAPDKVNCQECAGRQAVLAHLAQASPFWPWFRWLRQSVLLEDGRYELNQGLRRVWGRD
jgi:predicted RNA binding protein YcfA (HicA-like mRNA interferase family)